MFEASLIESGKHKGTQRWYTLPLSFLIHVVVVGSAVGLSMWFIEDIPEPPIPVQFYTQAAPPPPPPPPPPSLDFQGFLGPIHQGSAVHAGDAIPIVFSLGGDQGLDVLAAGSPSSARVDCDHPGAPTGGDPASSQSGRGLMFESSTGHYVFMWQTRKTWAGTCRTFVLGLRDGSVARLTVSFRSSRGWRPHW